MRRWDDDLLLLHGMVVHRKKVACLSKTVGKNGAKESDLWHRRLGHVSKQSVKKITGGIMDGMDLNKKAQTIDCIPCSEEN